MSPILEGTMSSPKVKRVWSNADVAKIYFADGHVAVFVANQGGRGEPTSIERFWLEHEQRTTVMFHSSYQYPVNYRPFGFVQMAPGYTVDRVAQYWQAAQDHVGKTNWTGPLADAWRVICLGIKDLREVKAGEWPAPASS